MAFPDALGTSQVAAHLRLTEVVSLDPSAATRLAGMYAAARAMVAKRVRSSIPEAVADAAILSVTAYMYDRPTASAGDRFAGAWHNSGAAAMCRDWVNRRAIVLPFTGAAKELADETIPAVEVPTVFDLRFATSADDVFTEAEFTTLGDTADGVLTPEVAGPVLVAVWLPTAAPDPLEWLRHDVGIPNLFTVGPLMLDVGGVSGRFWRSSIALNMWSGGRVDVRFPA